MRNMRRGQFFSYNLSNFLLSIHCCIVSATYAQYAQKLIFSSNLFNFFSSMHCWIMPATYARYAQRSFFKDGFVRSNNNHLSWNERNVVVVVVVVVVVHVGSCS